MLLKRANGQYLNSDNVDGFGVQAKGDGTYNVVAAYVIGPAAGGPANFATLVLANCPSQALAQGALDYLTNNVLINDGSVPFDLSTIPNLTPQ